MIVGLPRTSRYHRGPARPARGRPTVPLPAQVGAPGSGAPTRRRHRVRRSPPAGPTVEHRRAAHRTRRRPGGGRRDPHPRLQQGELVLPALVAQHPNARFVMTHRHPEAVIPSTCSVVADVRMPCPAGRRTRPRSVARCSSTSRPRCIGRWEIAPLGEDRFLDVGQYQVEHDPVATAEHASTTSPASNSAATCARQWLIGPRQPPRFGRGEHRYSAASSGSRPTASIRRSPTTSPPTGSSVAHPADPSTARIDTKFGVSSQSDDSGAPGHDHAHHRGAAGYGGTAHVRRPLRSGQDQSRRRRGGATARGPRSTATSPASPTCWNARCAPSSSVSPRGPLRRSAPKLSGSKQTVPRHWGNDRRTVARRVEDTGGQPQPAAVRIRRE